MEKLYLFLRAMYEEELARERSLKELGKAYLFLAALYSAFAIVVVENLRPETLVATMIFLAAMLAIMACLLLSVLALSVGGYERANTPKGVIDSLGEGPEINEREFLARRIADLSVAQDRNALVNDRQASRLAFAGALLVLGVLLHAAYFAAAVARFG
jgi:hypothetical protein